MRGEERRQRAILMIMGPGRMYAEGMEMPQDLVEAARLYRRVAKFQFRAQLELGRIYSRGVSVPTEPDEALRWYSAAAAREDDDWVDDSVKAAFVGCGTAEEIQEAKDHVA